MYSYSEVLPVWNDSLVSIDLCRRESRLIFHISPQCPLLTRENVSALCSFSHQEEVSLHGRGVPGCQLQDVALFDELVRGVNDVLLLTQHLVYLQQFLQILLNMGWDVYISGMLTRWRDCVFLKRIIQNICTYRFSYGAVGVSSCHGNDF